MEHMSLEHNWCTLADIKHGREMERGTEQQQQQQGSSRQQDVRSDKRAQFAAMSDDIWKDLCNHVRNALKTAHQVPLLPYPPDAAAGSMVTGSSGGSVDGRRGVHGDMRPPNILVKLPPGRHPIIDKSTPIRFIDFDWSGELGTARYPPFLNYQVCLWMSQGQVATNSQGIRILALVFTGIRQAVVHARTYNTAI